MLKNVPNGAGSRCALGHSSRLVRERKSGVDGLDREAHRRAMKVAWFLLACVTLACAVWGGKTWIEQPEYQVEKNGDSQVAPWVKWDARSGRMWLFVINTNRSGWVQIE